MFKFFMMMHFFAMCMFKIGFYKQTNSKLCLQSMKTQGITYLTIFLRRRIIVPFYLKGYIFLDHNWKKQGFFKVPRSTSPTFSIFSRINPLLLVLSGLESYAHIFHMFTILLFVLRFIFLWSLAAIVKGYVSKTLVRASGWVGTFITLRLALLWQIPKCLIHSKRFLLITAIF